MSPRRGDADDIVVVSLPRSAFTLVAPPPATVTQRTCLAHFGISKDDFLKMAAAGDFPITRRGQLRIARYADVEAALTKGAEPVRRRRGSAAPTPAETDSPDPQAAKILDRLGFRPRT